MKSGVVFMGMGFELAGLVIGSIYLGGQIDQHFGWKGYAGVVLILLCTFGWLFHLIVLLKRYQAKIQTPPNGGSDD